MIPEYSEESGVNIIVPHFDIPTPVEIAYHNKPVIAPVVICMTGLSHINQIKMCLISKIQLSCKMVWTILSNLCPMLRILLKLVG